MDTEFALPLATFDATRLNLPPFMERPPWHGGHLQTLRNALAPLAVDFSPFDVRRIIFPMRDGTGDQLLGSWHRPFCVEGRRRPLVLLIHGLTGDEESIYVRRTAHELLSSGFPVLRLNLRGAGPSRALCRQHYHAGRTSDLEAVIDGLPIEARSAGIVAVGFSLGGNLLLKYLGERGFDSPIKAAVAVSAPLDLAEASRRISAPSSVLYHGVFLNQLKRAFLSQHTGLSQVERRTVMGVRSLREFDDRFVAPTNGFSGAADYYSKCSSAKFLDRITVPVLLIHAEDDPIVPAESFRAVNWRNNRLLAPIVLKNGGHVGFHDRGAYTWHDLALRRFFELTFNFL